MDFKPFNNMWERIETAKQQSEEAFFNYLMYMGEMFTKFTVAGMVAGVEDGRDRNQYRLKYRLVRADGIGEWSQSLDLILTGVANQYTLFGHEEIKQLTQRVSESEWQYYSLSLLDRCLRVVDPHIEKLGTKIQLKNWFKVFTELRNKTRGHGAIPSNKIGQIIDNLEQSILVFQDNFTLFQLDWAYLKQTLKKRYRVITLNTNSVNFDFLKTHAGETYNLPEGLYVFFNPQSPNSIKRVDLVYTDIDISDIFLPNGHFKPNKEFEIISYLTGDTRNVDDAKNFMIPVDELPPSETEGNHSLSEHGKGNCVTNLPPRQKGYIFRSTPEQRVYEELVSSNEHRIITLLGRGGIGKTWLALEVLNKIADENEFQGIFWFSARDIDLLTDGAKQVKPHVLNQEDIAEEFFRLMGPWVFSSEELQQTEQNKQKRLSFLRDKMSSFDFGRALFVFDNFETVKSPIELYNWIDTYLRSPNKVLITTRFREFKGDYPIELKGMHESECRQLIDDTINKLGIHGLVSEDDKKRIYEESDGHPYIVKILLGEVRKTGRIYKPEYVISSKEDILDSLFERTYSRLPIPSQRIFLTLCEWKSMIAQTALEAVLLKEGVNVQQAVDDLVNSSLVETTELDGESFLSVPLVAMKFGKRKLNISSMQISIQDDVELLRLFGVVQQSDIRGGIKSRIDKLFKEIKKRIKNNSTHKIEDYEHIIRFLARKYSHTWLLWADLYNEIDDRENYIKTLISYIEFSEEDDDIQQIDVIRNLIYYYSIHNNPKEELSWRLKLSQIEDIDYDTISETANRFNNFINFNSPIRNMWDENERNKILSILIKLMNDRIQDATATDCSRLGWLYVYYGQKNKAIEVAERGLGINSENVFCTKLLINLRGGS